MSIAPDLRIYLGRPVCEDAVYEWCRRAPYLLSWTGSDRRAQVVRRDTESEAVTRDSTPMWPAFVERLRAVALIVSYQPSSPAVCGQPGPE
jgi:hypothetical protein